MTVQARPGTTLLPVSSLEENPDNPNVMDEERYAALVRSIHKGGFLQPILVRATGNAHYRVVDGNHRVKAAREAGLTVIPCVVAEMSDEAYVAESVGMNRRRGELVLLRVAEQLSSLTEAGMSVEDLADVGFSMGELDMLLKKGEDTDDPDLADSDVPTGEMAGDEETDDAEPLHTLSISFEDADEYAMVCRALRKAGRGYRAGVVRLAKEFLGGSG